MTINATYDPVLSRVQLTLVGLTDGLWTVERSMNGTVWETVRGGAAVTVESGGAALDDYEFAADVLNHYRCRPLDPPAGMLLDGSPGTYATTPDHASLDVTGDLDVRAEVQVPSWPTLNDPRLVCKLGTTGNQSSFQLRILATGYLSLTWSVTGNATGAPGRTSTLPIPMTAGEPLGLRATLDVDNGSAGHTVTFFYSTNWTTWTQLGAPVITAGVTSIFASTTQLSVGARTTPEADLLTGSVMRAEMRSGINGTIVANPDFTAQPGGTTVFVDSAGRTWTLGGNAEIVDAQDTTTITPSLGGQTWLKSIKYPFLNRPIKVLNFSDIARAARSGVFDVKGRSVPVAVHDLRGSPTFDLEVATRDFDDDTFDALVESRNMDLTLAAGGTMFVHVPDGDEVPGGYVTIGNTAAHRIAPGTGMTRMYTLPCQVVAKPSPEIVGTTMTWRTVERLYGSWQQLLASNPTWADLFQLIGSPDDLVNL